MLFRSKRADADDQKKLWTLDSSKSSTEQSTKRENPIAHQGRDEVVVESDEDGKGRSACWFARRGR